MTPYLRAANVKDGVLDLTDVKEMNFAPPEQQTFSLKYGDVLVTEGSGSLGSVGASAVWSGEIEGPVCFQNTLLRLRPRPGTDPRFLAWWCRHAFADGIFAGVALGANIFHISAERVRALPLRYVSLSVQCAIADYLDRETARIDALIEKKQKTIATIEERFDAMAWDEIIGARFTERKPCTLSWLRTIPAHWGTPTLSVNFDLQLGQMLNAASASGPEQSPYLRNVNVQWDHFDLEDLATMHFDDAAKRRCELRRNDLLVCEGGEVGRAAVWSGEPHDCYYQKAIHRVRPRQEANSRYLMYCLRVAARRSVFAVGGNLSTIAHLTSEQLRVHRFPWPPSDEQAQIVARLDRSAGATTYATGLIARQIALLQEYRQVLITAAVTGELEVPGVAA